MRRDFCQEFHQLILMRVRVASHGRLPCEPQGASSQKGTASGRYSGWDSRFCGKMCGLGALGGFVWFAAALGVSDAVNLARRLLFLISCVKPLPWALSQKRFVSGVVFRNLERQEGTSPGALLFALCFWGFVFGNLERQEAVPPAALLFGIRFQESLASGGGSSRRVAFQDSFSGTLGVREAPPPGVLLFASSFSVPTPTFRDSFSGARASGGASSRCTSFHAVAFRDSFSGIFGVREAASPGALLFLVRFREP